VSFVGNKGNKGRKKSGTEFLRGGVTGTAHYGGRTDCGSPIL
jgi:hypothetical protein